MSHTFVRSVALIAIASISLQAVAQSPSTPGIESANPNEKVNLAQAGPEDITNENFPNLIESFDYPNADISEVIKAISELTGKNFILGSDVKSQKITIVAPSQITVAEAYQAFLSALRMSGLTIVPAGKFLRIVAVRNVQREPLNIYAGAYFPNTDQMITRILKIRYTNSKELENTLRLLPSKDGELRAYEPTNSLIITDYGSNVERIVKIVRELDVKGFEEQLAVIPIIHATSKELADLLNRIINKDDQGARGRFSTSRFSRNKKTEGGSGATESLSLVVSDDRTNSVIVVGNQDGISRVRGLIKKLDFQLRPEDSGGVRVYYVKHGNAKSIADTLNGIAEKNNQDLQRDDQRRGNAPRITPPSARNDDNSGATTTSGALFSSEVKIASDEDTNSLIITASKNDYEVVLSILQKLDIPRDQVYVKVVILEMAVDGSNTASANIVRFLPGGDDNDKAVGRVGFVSSDIQNLLNPAAATQGAILGFASGNTLNLEIPNTSGGSSSTLEVSSFLGLINFLKSHTNTNVLSEPQIMAQDNSEATIEVGSEVPVGTQQSTGAGGIVSTGIERQKATIKLKIKPFINPDSDQVKLEIEQSVRNVSNSTTISATALAQNAIALDERSLNTTIVVPDGDTAVLGGLISDRDTESVSKIPVLGDIPLIGWLFRSKATRTEKRNLMLLISPRIIRSIESNDDLLSQKINERISFIQKNMKGIDPFGATIDKLPRRATLNQDAVETEGPFTEEPAAESF